MTIRPVPTKPVVPRNAKKSLLMLTAGDWVEIPADSVLLKRRVRLYWQNQIGVEIELAEDDETGQHFARLAR